MLQIYWEDDMFFTFQSIVFVGQPVLDRILREEINIFKTMKINKNAKTSSDENKNTK